LVYDFSIQVTLTFEEHEGSTTLMNRPTLPKRFITSPVVGERVSFTRTLTEADIALFIGTTWDVNPLHTDDVYCSATPFKHRIVPGLLTASLLTHLGGLWAFLATEMHFHFLAPVYVGDSITADAEVREVNLQTGQVLLGCRCTNQAGREVLRADIRGIPGRFE
jgi:3-hydroxybutyryl-CoA dehydratase